jgi:inner membrane transporter RhtA
MSGADLGRPRRTMALASLAIVVAQLSINIGAALGKGLFATIGPEGVAALRTLLSALLLLALSRPWKAVPTRAQTAWLILYGLALGGMNLLIYWSIERIPIGIAVAIEICGPLAVVLLTSRAMIDFLWLGLAVAGLALLVPWPGAEARLDPLGIAFALGAAACWGLYILFGKRASETEGMAAVAIGMSVACIVTVPFGVAAAGTNLVLGPVLAVGLAVALLSNAFPYLLEMHALERVSSRVFGVVTSTAPAMAALVGFFILGETLSAVQWLAIALMMTAGAGCSLAVGPGVRRARDDVIA